MAAQHCMACSGDASASQSSGYVESATTSSVGNMDLTKRINLYPRRAGMLMSSVIRKTSWRSAIGAPRGFNCVQHSMVFFGEGNIL